MKKRNKLEVIRDILKIIRENHDSIKPTPLLRYSNLSSQGFKEYIKELLGKELIEETYNKKKRKHFSLTKKGSRYLEKYSSIVDFIDYFDL